MFSLYSDYDGHRIHWEVKKGLPEIPYDGVPFIILGYEVRECQHGPDRNIQKKEQYRENRVTYLNYV